MAVTDTPMSSATAEEARRRRTFAIISHPDAGKTTLTEKLLLYGGALHEAGAVKARAQHRAVTSDWMELERRRGISVTSTAVSFEVGGVHLNLLDTPGHRDFSEDTYRVLVAADSAVMLLDAARGLQTQTLRLFEICRQRGLPIVTFVNKWDRPGRDALELLDEIESRLDLAPVPVTWPVGIAGDFRGVLSRADGAYHRFERTAHGATRAEKRTLGPAEAEALEGEAWVRAREELDLLDAAGHAYDDDAFRRGAQTPVFFGSAVSNFGVEQLLSAIASRAPAPPPPRDAEGRVRDLEEAFSAQVFKIQTNMEPKHRDTIAFARVLTGRFERGMRATVERTGRPLTLNYAHSLFGRERQSLVEAYPGDIVGIVNAGDLAIGDTLFAGRPVRYPSLPVFAPELFARAYNRDSARRKQFRRGLEQLSREGVVQLLHEPSVGPQSPVLAGVGQLQFEVATTRMAEEFGAPIETVPLPYTIARVVSAQDAPAVASSTLAMLLRREDGTHLAAFASEAQLRHFKVARPEVDLTRLDLG